MTIPYWVLWFTITVLNGQIMHIPVDGTYTTLAECEADLDHWLELMQSQWPEDPNIRTYCEAFKPNLPTQEL